MDTELCGRSLLQVLTLIGHWIAVVERRVQLLAIREPFELVEHGTLRGQLLIALGACALALLPPDV